MLGKMLKYDLKAMSKTMLPFFLVIIGMTVLNSFFIHFEWMTGIIAGSSIIFGLFIALGVTALVMIITQFYHNVLGDEGYLTNTLPVGVDVILFSKLLSAMIWLCLSGVVGIIVLFITLATTAGASEFFSATFDVIQAFFLAFREYTSGTLSVLLLVVLGILAFLVFLANEILHFYCAMACSQLPILSKNRIVGSFIAYFVLNIPLTILMAAIMGVDPGLYEAAQLDGASSTTMFWRITIPLIRPLLVYTLITSLIGGLQMFDVPQVLTNSKGDPNGSTNTIIMYLNQHLYSKNYGTAGAISVLMFLLCAVLCVIIYFTLTQEDDGLTREQRKAEKARIKAAKAAAKHH